GAGRARVVGHGARRDLRDHAERGAVLARPAQLALALRRPPAGLIGPAGHLAPPAPQLVLPPRRREARRLREPLDDGLASLPERNVVAQVEEVTMRLIDGLGPSGEADLVQDWSKKVGF